MWGNPVWWASGSWAHWSALHGDPHGAHDRVPLAFHHQRTERGVQSSDLYICYRTEGFLYISVFIFVLFVGIQTGSFPPAIFPLGILNFVCLGRHFHDWSHCCLLCWCFSESRWDGLCAFGGWDPTGSKLAVFGQKKVLKYSKYRQICRVSFLMLTSKREYMGIWHRQYRLWKSACGFLWRHWPHNFWNPRSAESKTKELLRVVVPLWENEAVVTCCDQFGFGVLNLHAEGAGSLVRYPNLWLPGLRSLRNFGLQRRDCYSLQMYLLVVWTIQAIMEIINGTAFL